MSNVHRFEPRPKTPPPPRRHRPFGRAPWLPWLLVLLGAAVLALIGGGGLATPLVVLAIVLAGGWLDRRG